MKKIIEFLKTNIIVAKWTFWYFLTVWLILKFVFKFDIFSYNYWWKFFHSTLHGFGGFVFGTLVYTAIPIYIATTITVYRQKGLIIKIPFIDKIVGKLFVKTQKSEPIKTTTEPEPEPEISKPEFPDDLPPELRTPFTRARNNLSLHGPTTVYNKQPTKTPVIEHAEETEVAPMPIPMDFDVSDTIEQDMNDSVPTFKDINFDIPIATESELENNTTKYMKEKNIEYETYHEFVATEKFVIYEHNDEDFWIMDDDSWFASGKQKNSPVSELITLAKQNNLTPVIYLASQNIMNIDDTINNFESSGIRVVKSLDELN